ncbi:hypothetical protein ACOSQ2_023591 [Xanthoceras sorbifolium]
MVLKGNRDKSGKNNKRDMMGRINSGVFVVIVKQLEFPEFLLCLLPALALCTRRRLVLSKPRSRGIIA